jgi:hypothetical protein
MRFNFLIVSVFFIFISTNLIAQVGIGTTGDPDASSILEIQSTSKGVLIPRMNEAARLLIKDPATGIPAQGLLVFDTNSNSFWYYNNGWIELVSEKTLVDADNDTKIEVEKTADIDEIHFTTKDSLRMKIGADGEILMGVDLASQTTTSFEIDTDGVIKLGNKGASTLTGGPLGLPESDATGLENYTKIAADGSLSYVGNATRWEDLKVPVNSVKIKAKKNTDGTDIAPAEWAGFKTGTSLALLWFKDEGNAENEQEVVFTVQMPHGWKEGTDIYPHVHWTTGKLKDDGTLEYATKPGTTGRVTWGLEYTWASLGEDFPATDIFYGSTLAKVAEPYDMDFYEHHLTPLVDPNDGAPISGVGQTLSSMLVCRLFRNSSATTDTYPGDAGLLEIDFHFQVDSDGSNQEYTKQN